uniref:Minor capsid protein n=1 Tax=Gokushovirinae environmental samples TaxID=1478972 RepID=A0A2R3UAT8_9VIRU|nr:minor capsid protein [Gokushovirinae environmental samples]
MVDAESGEITEEVPAPFFRTAFNYDRDMVSEQTGLRCLDATRTQQQHAEEVDINTIVERFGLTGAMPGSFRAPSFQDFEGVFDFKTAMDSVQAAREEFMMLPAKVRARFGNDPQNLLEFVNDDGNRAEAIKLGLVRDQAVDLAASPKAAPGASVATPTAAPGGGNPPS